MTQHLSVVTDDEITLPRREANKQRGKANLQLALDFVKDFPVGSSLDSKAFDEWAQHRGLLNVPVNAPKDSDAWKAHLMRRHELRYRINRSGTHPRLIDENSTPFSLDTLRTGLYEVRSPHVAIAQSGLPAKIASVTNTKRKQLAYLMESADWEALPPYERVVAEAIFDDIDAFSDRINADADRISQKLSKLSFRIKQAVEAGEIKPTNGGIHRLIAPSSNDESEEGAA